MGVGISLEALKKHFPEKKSESVYQEKKSSVNLGPEDDRE